MAVVRTRRQLLAAIGAAAVAATVGALRATHGPRALTSPSPAAPPDPLVAPAVADALATRVGARRDLTEAAFTYVGSFEMPQLAGGDEASYGLGYTLRRVDGQLRALSVTLHHTLYEVAVPAPVAGGTWPRAQVTRTWAGALAQRPLDPPAGRGSSVHGIHWDELDQRLYYGYGDDYNAASATDPAVGACSLDDVGAATFIGAWRFGNRGQKAAMGGVVELPEWFVAQACPGRRLAAGFGGYYSIVATGPCSMGPALTAFDPADASAARHLLDLPRTDLVGYPYTYAPGPATDRCHRSADYTNEFDGWQPVNGTGYWNWTDLLWQGGVVIDTPAVSGLLMLPTLGTGRVWYETSNLHSQGATHWWYAYRWGDLADVAGGRREQWQVQPGASWQVRYPRLPDPLPAWDTGHRHMVVGAAFDPVEARLHVVTRAGWSGGYVGEFGHTVHVYSVS